MSVARNNEPKIVMNGWRGLNEAFAPAHLQPGDLAAVKNMDLRDGVALASRLGQRGEHDRVYFPNLQGVRRMLRYKSSTGVKKRIVMFGNTLRADYNDNGKYGDDGHGNNVDIVTIPGTPWFFQFYDVVLFGSDQQDMGVYDPIGGTVTYPNMDPNWGAFESWWSDPTDLTLGMRLVADGGYITDEKYAYRFTFDISVGGVFLGETGPIEASAGLFWTGNVDASGGADDDNYVQFQRPSDYTIDRAPENVSAINFYRSAPISDAVSIVEERYDLLWIGSVAWDTVVAATFRDVIFTDTGALGFGKPIRRPSLIRAPRSKRIEMHKSRLWFSSPRIQANDETSYTYYPDLVAWCENGANGTEPLVVFPESTVPVGGGEPDEMTVIKSIRNQALGILKEDKTYAILGADDELFPGVPNLSVQLIDGFTGCSSPDTAVAVDGGAVMFLSERGVMVWDGAAPRPVKYDSIKNTLATIPGTRKAKAVASYNPFRREYDLFFTTSKTGGYNRDYLRFNFNNNSWVGGELQRGVSAVLWVNDADADGYMLWGIDDVPFTTFASTPWVQKADSGFKEGVDANPNATEQIHFEVDLGYQDGGAPWLRKQWKEIAVEFESQVPLSLSLWVDNKGPYSQIDLSAPTDADTLVWGTSNWGESKWASSSFGTSRRILTNALNNLPKGNSIRCILSGINIYQPVKLYSVTVFYTPEES